MTALEYHRSRRRARGGRARGFTLVELMVAITGGLFVSMAVFALSRQGSIFYKQETRIASATMASMIGFERLRADISRAGFLASPNVRVDPKVCGTPTTDPSWPTQLRNLQSVHIETNFLTGHPILDHANNSNIQPDRITLAGSYVSIDQFPVYLVEASSSGAGFTVFLQSNTGPMARIGGGANIGDVFQTGRALRLVDKSGSVHFGTITGVTAGAQPQVHLSNAPALKFRNPAAGSSTTVCGLKGFETGALANVVNFVRYELRDLTLDANYAALYPTGEPTPFDNIGTAGTRLELARYEVDTSGSELAGTTELVAELGVDLAFGVTAATSVLNGDQTVETFPPKDGDVQTYAKSVATGGLPQRIRTVRARLSVRSREADRRGNIGLGVPLYRVWLKDDVTERTGYARVRTLQSDITLHNQTGVTW